MEPLCIYTNPLPFLTMTPKPHRALIDQFWKSRTEINDCLVATHFKIDDTHDIDFEFVSRLIEPQHSVLDLGAGTCILSSRLAPHVHKVIAVDKFNKFLEAAPKTPNLTRVESDVFHFKSDTPFDLVLLFGVTNYFDTEETLLIYQRCAGLLKSHGKLILKHQCGVRDDVFIDRFSEQIGGRYISFYKHLEKEIKQLESLFKRVEVIDIYPPENNPWPDTHFYAFICSNEA